MLFRSARLTLPLSGESTLPITKKDNPGRGSSQEQEIYHERGRRVEWIKKFRVIAHVLDLDRVAASEGLKPWERAAIKSMGSHRPPKPEGSIRLREYRPEDLDGCLALLSRYQQSVTLSLVWDREGLAWELLHPGVVQTLVCEKDGRIEGLVNFIYHDHLGKTAEKWAWIHHLAYPDFDGIFAYVLSLIHAGFRFSISKTRKSPDCGKARSDAFSSSQGASSCGIFPAARRCSEERFFKTASLEYQRL